MLALVKSKPLPGLELREVPVPDIGPHEVLVKVRACSICGTDLHLYRWDGAIKERARTPLVIGHELCGYVVATGRAVERLREGDYVSADSHLPDWTCAVCRQGLPHLCRNLQILGVDRPGAFAEYVAVPESSLWVNDTTLDPAVASIQDPMGNAVHAALAEPVSGRSVVIFGDGPTGLGATAVANASGAWPIVLVGLSAFLLEIGAQVGASLCINAGTQDVLSEIQRLLPDGADVVLEMSGSPAAVRQGLQVLKPGGCFIAFGLPAEKITLDLGAEIVFKGVRLIGVTGRRLWDTWYQMGALLRSGKVDFQPIITHRLPFTQWQLGFEQLLAPERQAAKVVLFMNPEDEAMRSAARR